MYAAIRPLILALLLSIAGTGVIRSVAAQSGDAQADPPSGVEELDPGEAGVVSRMSDRLGVPAPELVAWRRHGLGWGDIEMAMLLAAHTGESAERVVGLWKDNGRRWQPVGDVLGVPDVEALMAETRADD